MSKVYETGCAKNAANFETLITYAIGYGAIYKPSKTSINIGNMQIQLVKVKDAVSELHTTLASCSNAIAAREIGFEPIQKLSTRLLNSLKATDTPTQIIENAATINRKLQGKRVSPKLTEEEKNALAAEGKVINQISASQQSYDSVLDHFDKLVKLLSSIPQYKPNETELKITTLTALNTTLKQLNTTVITNEIALSNVRLLRNEVMYNLQTGLVVTAQDVKTYVKSLFGATSVQYKQISGLSFRMVK
ncbi:hypothetical protein GM921_11360 [Pedobacter sp. LMG 31464]|uniref:Uncharacterized protein n=1 Tax=Pedobacter planticolens TaxID=2679964 RepID=A0A923IUL8_9SPHI|nr:hypothetical protein [Pedobacter planticolens]MBB2146085.1 hypothetical protein [Pedobacter planticolens]